jgi:aerobic-type carbon monoxide dehydrogenase small subunit (CoxS/CutS family)
MAGKKSGQPESTGIGLTGIKMSRRAFIKTSIAASAVAVSLTSTRGSLAQTTTIQQRTLDPFEPRQITLNINGKDYKVLVEPREMLVNVLREKIGLIGTKRPCNRMECGGCTVLIDDKPYYACTYLAIRAQGKRILTVEGRDVDPILRTLQDAWVEADASQCGYCQPGMLMSATALLKKNPNPTVEEIKSAMAGNLCRCGTYMNIIEAIQIASRRLRGGV